MLVDKIGRPRGEFSVDAEGKAALSLMDKDEHTRVSLYTRVSGEPTTEFGDQLGKTADRHGCRRLRPAV